MVDRRTLDFVSTLSTLLSQINDILDLSKIDTKMVI